MSPVEKIMREKVAAGWSDTEIARFLMITRCPAELPRVRTFEALKERITAIRESLTTEHAEAQNPI